MARASGELSQALFSDSKTATLSSAQIRKKHKESVAEEVLPTTNRKEKQIEKTTCLLNHCELVVSHKGMEIRS